MWNGTGQSCLLADKNGKQRCKSCEAMYPCGWDMQEALRRTEQLAAEGLRQKADGTRGLILPKVSV